MHIALLCATNRGLQFLRRLKELAPEAKLTVFSFREDQLEPAFLDSIRQEVVSGNSVFIETRKVESTRYQHIWRPDEVDIAFVVSWRYRIPEEVYKKPRLGTFVFHDSLLPEYRGFSPTVWSIINGEDHTGATLFRIADEIDSGDIVDQHRIEIGSSEPIASVMARTTEAYLDLLAKNLDQLLKGTARTRSQDHSKATYACKRTASDNQVNWSKSSLDIFNLIRAVSKPYSGAYTTCDGHKVRIWAARLTNDLPPYVGRIPGRVVRMLKNGVITVLTGSHAIDLTAFEVESHDKQPQTIDANKVIRLGSTLE